MTVAMQSIDGMFSTIYGYDVTDARDPWKAFDPTAPSWVNDLGQVSFAQGYLINISQTTTISTRSWCCDYTAARNGRKSSSPPSVSQRHRRICCAGCPRLFTMVRSHLPVVFQSAARI